MIDMVVSSLLMYRVPASRKVEKPSSDGKDKKVALTWEFRYGFVLHNYLTGWFLIDLLANLPLWSVAALDVRSRRLSEMLSWCDYTWSYLEHIETTPSVGCDVTNGYVLSLCLAPHVLELQQHAAVLRKLEDVPSNTALGPLGAAGAPPAPRPGAPGSRGGASS